MRGALEHELAGCRAGDAHLRLEPGDLEAGGAGLDDERGDAGVPCARVGLGEDRVHVRDRRVRDEALRAVEDVLVAVAGARSSASPRSRSPIRPRSARTRRATRPTRGSGGSAPSARASPASLRASEPSSCTARISPLVAQTFETSSIATSASSVPVPVPPCSSSKRSPKMPCSRKSSTTSQGNSCEASISAARGAMRSRASVRTSARISSCSSLRVLPGQRGV